MYCRVKIRYGKTVLAGDADLDISRRIDRYYLPFPNVIFRIIHTFIMNFTFALKNIYLLFKYGQMLDKAGLLFTMLHIPRLYSVGEQPTCFLNSLEK